MVFFIFYLSIHNLKINVQKNNKKNINLCNSETDTYWPAETPRVFWRAIVPAYELHKL